MSQIKIASYCSVLALALSLCACGDTNSKVVFSPDSGKHLPGWTTGHSSSARADQETCFECHGENLQGGISGISCTKCHLGSSAAIHPDQWGEYAYARHKNFVAANGTSRCANATCHGATLTGVIGSGPSCATECHLGGAAAKHAWTQSSGHASFAKSLGIAKCSTDVCHGTNSKGVFLSGPACDQCHLGGFTAVHPPTAAWRDTDHKGYILPGLTIVQTRAKCDIAACHGTFNDAAKPGQVKVSKACATSSCHAGDKN